MVDVATIKNLREITGAGMMDCKKALAETNGDLQAAIDLLRKKGIAAAAKKGARTAAEGLIAQKVSDNVAVTLELNSETDFVAKNEEFRKLANQILDTALNAADVGQLSSDAAISESITNAISVIGENIQLRRVKKITNDNGFIVSYIHSSVTDTLGRIGVLLSVETDNDSAEAKALARQIAMHVAANSPLALYQDDVPADAVAKEKEIFSEQAKASGKPENIIEKMVEGRIRKFYEEVVLVDQAFVIDGKTPVKDVIAAFTKENNCSFKLKEYIRFQVGEGIEKEADDFADEVKSIVANS